VKSSELKSVRIKLKLGLLSLMPLFAPGEQVTKEKKSPL
jgi:hypothetical protein